MPRQPNPTQKSQISRIYPVLSRMLSEHVRKQRDGSLEEFKKALIGKLESDDLKPWERVEKHLDPAIEIPKSVLIEQLTQRIMKFKPQSEVVRNQTEIDKEDLLEFRRTITCWIAGRMKSAELKNSSSQELIDWMNKLIARVKADDFSCAIFFPKTKRIFNQYPTESQRKVLIDSIVEVIADDSGIYNHIVAGHSTSTSSRTSASAGLSRNSMFSQSTLPIAPKEVSAKMEENSQHSPKMVSISDFLRFDNEDEAKEKGFSTALDDLFNPLTSSSEFEDHYNTTRKTR